MEINTNKIGLSPIKNKLTLTALGAAALVPCVSHAEDFNAVTALTGAVTSGTTIFSLAAALGVLMLVWAIGRKVLFRGAK